MNSMLLCLRKRYTRSFCKCVCLPFLVDSKIRAPVKWQHIYVREGDENYIHIMFVSFHYFSTDSAAENTVHRNFSKQCTRTLKDQCIAHPKPVKTPVSPLSSLCSGSCCFQDRVHVI